MSKQIDEIVFEYYTRHTGTPSYIWEDFAEVLTKQVAQECAAIADEQENISQVGCAEAVGIEIRRRFDLGTP